jgi:hypothetical protein
MLWPKLVAQTIRCRKCTTSEPWYDHCLPLCRLCRICPLNCDDRCGFPAFFCVVHKLDSFPSNEVLLGQAEAVPVPMVVGGSHIILIL